jgi:hypothetical protein
VMFEAHPQPSRRDTHLELATLLGTDLRQIPGFVDNDDAARTRSMLISATPSRKTTSAAPRTIRSRVAASRPETRSSGSSLDTRGC